MSDDTFVQQMAYVYEYLEDELETNKQKVIVQFGGKDENNDDSFFAPECQRGIVVLIL